MSDIVSHTIRFNQSTKEIIRRVGEEQGRTFQAQVEHMLDEQLKDEVVVYFLNQVRCSLEALAFEERADLMAKIAKLVGLD